MLYTKDFSMHYNVGFLQIGSQIMITHDITFVVLDIRMSTCSSFCYNNGLSLIASSIAK